MGEAGEPKRKPWALCCCTANADEVREETELPPVKIMVEPEQPKTPVLDDPTSFEDPRSPTRQRTPLKHRRSGAGKDDASVRF